MNNRFKFRVWSKQSNSYIKEKMFYIDKFGYLFKYEKSKSTVYINAPSPYVMCLCGDNYIIEQCTGLKDKNGKLIYEGDIILVEDNKCPIEWESENARYNVVGYGEIAYLNYNDIEVIGNIHENADLIKVGGK